MGNNKEGIPTLPRECLKCGSKFNSTGPGNRICPHCHQSNRSVGKPAIEPVHNGMVFRKGLQNES